MEKTELLKNGEYAPEKEFGIRPADAQVKTGLWCPYIAAACREDDCGLWSEENGQCAMLAMAENADLAIGAVCVHIEELTNVLRAMALQLGIDAADLEPKGEQE